MPVELQEYQPLPKGARFPIGKVFATTGILNCVPSDDLWIALARHQRGEWGDLDQNHKSQNEKALLGRHRLLSSYQSVSGARFWIITQASRRVTNVLLPSEY